MEHVNDDDAPFVTAPFYASRSREGGMVEVRQVDPARVVAIIPHDINGLPGHEGWKWGTRVARGLCYDVAGVKRAQRAAYKGFVVGLALGLAAMCLTIVALGLRLPSQCVDLGPYTTVPNG